MDSKSYKAAEFEQDLTDTYMGPKIPKDVDGYPQTLTKQHVPFVTLDSKKPVKATLLSSAILENQVRKQTDEKRAQSRKKKLGPVIKQKS